MVIELCLLGLIFGFAQSEVQLPLSFLALFMASRKDTENAPADAEKKKTIS